MKIEDGEVISEIWPQNSPGNYGNAMAETGRYAHLIMWAGCGPKAPIDLLGFRGIVGYYESKSSFCPAWWVVSSDQCIPWYLAVKRSSLWLAQEMEQRIKENGYRTDDGNIATPPLIALISHSQLLLNIVVLIQALLFKLPYRWDDGQKKFVPMKDSSADYLNWFHCALYCPKWIRKCVSKDTLIAKIQDYYKPEPNNDWVIELYKLVIEMRYD